MISSKSLISRTAALAAAAALFLGVGGCAGAADDAATVTLSSGGGGEKTTVHIARADVEDDLRILRSNDDFISFVKTGGLDVPESGSSAGAELTAIWLGILVDQVVIDTELQERDVKVTKADRDAVADQVDQAYGGAAVFKQFPKAFRDAVVEREARMNALITRGGAKAEPPTEADAKKFYDENAAQISTCASGISVSHILLETEPDAVAVKAELMGGADFATLAKERSTDPTAADSGGDLGCLQDGAFVAPFEAAAKAATIGVPTDPVKTEFGYHVILTSAFVPPTFEAMKGKIIDYLAGKAEQSAGQEIKTIIQDRLKGAEVDVDPRYGAWVSDDQKGPHVAPPSVPEPPDGRGASTTTTVPVDLLGTVPAQGG